MTQRIAGTRLLFGAALLGLGTLAGFAAVERPIKVPSAHRAIEPVAPALPGHIVAAIQEGKYDDAVSGLKTIAADPKTRGEDAPYLQLAIGVTQRISGKLDAARATLTAAIDAAPKSPWAGKLRAELAVVELAAGRFDRAEQLARAETETLLADSRKDRLANIYRDFAQRLLDPDSPVAPRDPEGAHALLEQARTLAKSSELRAKLLLEMSQASQSANNHARALTEFQTYLQDYPKGDDRDQARFGLGEAQFAANQHPNARLTWTDLARDLEKSDTKAAQDLRARALDGIARTYGIPNPGDDASLNLGVAALKRLLAAYPSDPLAVQAAYQIGQAYLARGKSQDAIAAFRAFLKGDAFTASTDKAKEKQATLTMSAQFQIGQILQGQERFDEAITAFQGYLSKFPNGPQSAAAQRAMLDTRLLIASDHLRHKQYAEARAAWQEFINGNPLDPRVPQTLFQIGESFAIEKSFDQAIAAWETLVGKFPGTEPAAHAQFEIASTFETEKGDPTEAIERFKKVNVDPWQGQARQRIAVMEARALTVVTPRAFRSGETPYLKITTRNLEKLTFTAYKLNAESYFRKKHALDGVESLDIGLVQPDAEWTIDVPGYARYKPIESKYDLPKVKVPGVYVVKVTDETSLQATTLVLGSDLDVIVKASRDQLLVFAQDMKTGKGRAGARVLIAGNDDSGEPGIPEPPEPNAPPAADVIPPVPVPPCSPDDAEPADAEPVVRDETTGKDGVLVKTWDKPRDPSTPLHYLVIDGENVAGSDLGVPDSVSQGLSARAYLYTDRPAYRPGQSVELRGVVREVVKGQYANVPKATYRLEVTDSRGRPFVARSITLTDFGTFHESLTVDDGAPVGTYRVRVYQPGKSEFTGQFEVQAYKLEKVALKIDLPRTVYFRGETIEADVVATYQYGTPLAGRSITVSLPDGRTLQGTTDASGKYHVSMETTGFAEEQALNLMAHLPQDNVATAATVMLAVRAFSIETHTSRDVYLDGESFRVEVNTEDAQGEPTGQTLTLRVLKQVEVAGRTTEREVETLEVKTDPKTGKGSIALKVDDADGGRYIVRVAGTDRFGNPVVHDLPLTISGKKDETKLRILADRQEFKVGEEATVRLHNRGKPSTALLTWEADRILSYKVVPIKEGDNPLSWTVDGPQFPNFTLSAARMAETRFDEARLDVKVTRDLQVSITPIKDAVGPGDDVEIEVTTRDQLGQPVAAELSLALVDEALLRLFQDDQPPIGPFFYDQVRTGAFATESTNTFRYEPTSVPVPEAVAEEDARREMIQLGDRARDASDLFGVKTESAPAAISADADRPAPEAGPIDPNQLPARKLAEMAREKNARFFANDAAAGRPGSGMMGSMGGGMGGMIGAKIVQERDVERLGKLRANLDKSGVTGLPRAPDFGGEPTDAAKRQAGMAESELAFSFRAGSNRGVDAVQTPRQSFIETAYWNPSVVTGKDGKARVKFKAPTALSRYRLTSRGVTGSDTLAGQATAELRVRKDFFVDLKVPSVLTQGDKPRFSAQLHHGGDGQGDADVRLAIYAGGRDQVIPRTIPIKGAGVEEILFDPFEVPDGDMVRLELKAKLGDASDTLVVEVPIRPWGVQAFASASGTASDDATSFLELPSGREYENPEMQIVLSPTLRRMLVELALGRDAYPLDRKIIDCFPIPPDTLADRASDLLAAVSALGYLRNVGGADAPEATRLTDRIRALAAELVTSQNDDGGWPWTRGASNRDASARATWALAAAAPLGLVPSTQALDKAVTYLTGEFPKVESSDHDTRAAILHALATRHKATFEQANALNRLRQGLSDIALAYLALTFHELDRKALGGEVLDVLGPKAKTESAGPGLPPRRYWEGTSPHPFHRGPAEATALASLAYAQLRPDASELNGAVAWLLAHRVGNGWQPPKAKGPALAALGRYYGQAKGADDRYRLTVTVNDETVYNADVVGATEGTSLRVPTRALKAGGKNRVHFDIEGRGTLGYAVTLTGFTRDFEPDQTPANRPFVVQRRVYRPAEPELDGKTLPSGFGVAVNPTHFENTISQLPQGGRARVAIEAYRVQRAGQPAWERDFLVLEEHLPAGATLVDGSIQSQASHHELADGVLTLYFAPDQWPSCTYEVFGYLPGDYRALPARLRSAYEPGRLHLGKPGDLKVLPPGEKSSDPYKPTPDELYARGKGLFDADRLAEAAPPLEALWSAYTLRDDVAKDAARMLLVIHIKTYDPRKVVQYFEILKEKAPELVIPFDQIRVIGKAYADIGEHERAYLVWRATAEASYLEDARVGEALRQRGKTLEGLAFLLDLWREYPGTASIEADFFGLSQVLASLATRAVNEPGLRRELLDAGVSRDDLLTQEIRLIQAFLTLSPKSPLADEASLALAGAFLEREDYESVVTLSRRFAGLYPKSTFLDSFQYSEALGLFHLGQHDRAIEVAETIARATYKDASGVEQPSPNKWQALYILGQIYDARRQPAQAVAYYKRVADRFTDASDAVRDLTRKALSLPEVSVLRPTEAPKQAGVGLRSMPPEQPGVALDQVKSRVELAYRNIAEADVKVYPVDLMRLYLARRSLDGIAGIDLAGITPLFEKTVTLGDGADFADKLKPLDLPMDHEGAYLVMVRGDNLYASGIALVTPLEIEVREEATAGRVRVTVRDSKTRDPVPKVQVKVIGTGNGRFFGGETDLRGVFTAEGVQGQVTAVARRGSAQYAFYRGTTPIGVPPAASKSKPAATPAPGANDTPPAEYQSLEGNIRLQNSTNQIRQLERLQNRYNAPAAPGVQVEGVK